MVMTDHILFVKETKTCSYVLVIHTPRLCGEPGFKSRRDSVDEAPIRCREVVDALPPPDSTTPWSKLPPGDSPMKFPKRRPVLPSPLPGAVRPGSNQGSVGRGKEGKAKPNSDDASSPQDSGADSSTDKTKEQLYSDLIDKTLQLLMNHDGAGVLDKLKSGRKGASVIVNEDGDIIVEYDEDGNDDGAEALNQNIILEALKAAGVIDAREQKESASGASSKKSGSSSNSKNSKDSKDTDRKSVV